MLVNICEQKGYQESVLLNDIKEDVQRMNGKITAHEAEIAEIEETIEFVKKIEQIENASTSILNSITSAISASNSKNELDGLYESIYGKTQDNSKTDTSINNLSSGNKNNISEQQSYNTDKRTYTNYDSMLSQVFAGHREASSSEIRNWQSKMKQLRTKWEAIGKSFPKSANESK